MNERAQCEIGIHQNPGGEHRQKLYDIGHSNLFHDTIPKARETKDTMNLWDFNKIKFSAQTRKQSKKTKRQPTECETIFANDTTDKRLVSNIYKEHLKLNTWETNNQIKNWAEDMNRHFFHDTSPKARETKDKMNLWDFIKIKSSAQPRKQSNKLSGSPRNGRRDLQMTLQIKDWYPRSTKNFSNSIHKKQIIQSRNGQKT